MVRPDRFYPDQNSSDRPRGACRLVNVAYCSSVLFAKENGVLSFLQQAVAVDEVSVGITVTLLYKNNDDFDSSLVS